MEATPNGERVTEAGYIQQHEPYLGMELIYRGHVQQGLEVMRRRQRITWEVNASPWAEALATNTPNGQECGLQDYMTAPSTWNVLYALSGATLDITKGKLRIRPQLTGERRARLPLILQSVWLMLDIDLDRDEPLQVDIRHIVEGTPMPAIIEAEVPEHGFIRLPLHKESLT